MDATPARGGREPLLDAVFGLAVTTLAVVSVLTHDPAVAYEFRDPTPGAVVLALAAGLPLVVRRRWPLAVSITVTAAVVTLAALGSGPGRRSCACCSACTPSPLTEVAGGRSSRSA